MKRAWNVFYRQFITYGGYKTVLDGLASTVEIAVFGLCLGIAVGTIVAVVRVVPKRGAAPRLADAVAGAYVAFFRGTPIVVQLLLGYWVILPAMGVNADGVTVAIAVFGLNSGAYVSEIMRGGINSVDVGQLEAGRAVGLSYGKAMTRIVIPQAIKNIMPTLGNEFIALIKETSVVSFIAVVDITKAFQSMAGATYEYVVPYLVLALFYLALVLCVTLLVRLIEGRLARSERN